MCASTSSIDMNAPGVVAPSAVPSKVRAAVVRELASTVSAPLAATLPAAVVRLNAASVAV